MPLSGVCGIPILVDFTEKKDKPWGKHHGGDMPDFVDCMLKVDPQARWPMARSLSHRWLEPAIEGDARVPT